MGATCQFKGPPHACAHTHTHTHTHTRTHAHTRAPATSLSRMHARTHNPNLSVREDNSPLLPHDKETVSTFSRLFLRYHRPSRAAGGGVSKYMLEAGATFQCNNLHLTQPTVSPPTTTTPICPPQECLMEAERTRYSTPRSPRRSARRRCSCCRGSRCWITFR